MQFRKNNRKKEKPKLLQFFSLNSLVNPHHIAIYIGCNIDLLVEANLDDFLIP